MVIRFSRLIATHTQTHTGIASTTFVHAHCYKQPVRRTISEKDLTFDIRVSLVNIHNTKFNDFCVIFLLLLTLEI